MPRNSFARAAVAMVLGFGASVASAQSALRILRYSPTDTATAGSIITVTFNRPVAGMLDATISARDVMTIKPAVAGVYEWRDPITLRFVPNEPLVADHEYSVSIDTAAIATVGQRHATPFQFVIKVPGPTLLRTFTDEAYVGGYGIPSVGAHPRFRLLYSSAVDSATVARISRINFSESCGGMVPLHIVTQRAVNSSDPADMRDQTWASTDERSLHRVVELTMRDSIPAGCTGQWVVPLFNDRRKRTEEVRTFRTYPAFTIDSIAGCLRDNGNTTAICDPNGVIVWFSTPVNVQTLKAHVHSFPALPQQSSGYGAASAAVVFAPNVQPRQHYTISADTGLRDVLGRKLQGAQSITVTTRDRAPAVQYQSELVSLSPTSPMLSVRVVNVDTLLMYVAPIPDSIVPLAIGTSYGGRYMTLQRINPKLLAPTRIAIPVHGTFNRDTVIAVRMPTLPLDAPGNIALAGPVAVRFAIGAQTPAPESSAAPAARVTDPALSDAYARLGLITQVSNLRVHAKMSEKSGAMFVTDVRGHAVPKASVTLLNELRDTLAAGRSDANGLAMLIAKPLATARPLKKPAYNDLRATYLDIRLGADRLISPVQSSVGNTLRASITPWELSDHVRAGDVAHSAVFTDRGIYRPGELMYVKTYVRYGVVGSIAVPKPDSIRLTMFRVDPSGAMHSDIKQFVRFNAFGSATDSIRIPTAARVGAYTLETEVRVNDTWHNLGLTDFQVAEFRAPDYLVTLAADSSRHYAGDTIYVDVNANYLFGAPMRGGTVKWSAFIGVSDGLESSIPGTKGYAVGENNWWDANANPPFVLLGARDSLNDAGHLDLKVVTRDKNIVAPAALKVDVSVIDINNQVVTKSLTVTLREASFAVAARRRGNDWYWKTGVQQTIDAFLVQPSGKRVAGVPLMAKIIRRRWQVDSASEFGAPHWVADTVGRVQVISKMDSVPIQFTPADDGAYDVRIEATDELGRTATTNIGQWACYEWWSGTFGTNLLKLHVASQHTNDEPYSIGDTAHVSFDSPFERATAWITYEREGVTQQRTLAVKRGKTVLDVPITSRMAPNIWVGVTLIKQDNAPITSADAAEEVLRAGYTQLRVDRTGHALRITLRPQKPMFGAGDSAHIRIDVREKSAKNNERGVRSEVTLWAVDEGVLSLTDYKTPDVLSLIDQQLGVSSQLVSTLTELPWTRARGPLGIGVSFRSRNDGPVSRLSAVAIGPRTQTLDVDAISLKTRSAFRFTAFFIGSVITGENGVAEIRAKLPDNITTFRLMATAVSTGERYGSTEIPLLVSQRVVLRASLPRFVRKGDSLSTGAVVSVRDSANALLNVRASVSDGMLRGDSVQTARINNHRGANVRFDLSVPEHIDATGIRVQLTAVDTAVKDGDAFLTTLPVLEAGSPRAHTAVGMLRDNGTITVQLPANIDAERSTVSISLGTSPLVAMRSHYAQLQSYGNYSTELLVTSARALLSLSRAERALGDAVVARDSGNVAKNVQTAVNELAQRQIDDRGVFANWKGSDRAEGWWLTAYAGTFLLEARRAGADVSTELLENIVSEMQLVLYRSHLRLDTLANDSLARRAYLRSTTGARVVALQYLRNAGVPELPAEDSLLAFSNFMSWEDRASFVALLASRPDHATQSRALLNELWESVSVAGKRIDLPDSLRGAEPWPSHIRPAARLLLATMQVMPEHPLLGALAETLIQQGSVSSGWAWNSIDYGSAIEALAKFANAQRGDASTKVVARDRNGRVVFSRTTAAASRALLSSVDSVMSLSGIIDGANADSAQLTLAMRFESNSIGERAARNAPLYYAVTVSEVPLQRPVTPDIAGMFVERWYEEFASGKPLTEVREGDLVRVRLRLTVPADRQYVTVEDMLPAGLEVVDLSLATSATVGPFASRDSTPYYMLGRDQSEDIPEWQQGLTGSMDGGWWSPWEHREVRDDRVFYFARALWSGTYSATYLARATTAGTFVKPPAHAEEMYNRALQGRSDGGVFVVKARR